MKSHLLSGKWLFSSVKDMDLFFLFGRIRGFYIGAFQ